MVAAVLLGAGLIALDHRVPQARDWPLLFPGGADSACNLLSTIAAPAQVVRRLRGALNDLLDAAPPARRDRWRDIDREFDDRLDRARARRPTNVS